MRTAKGLADEKDLPRLHVILDASKVKRCDWCGSAQSEDWRVSDLGTFCSEECSKASTAGGFSFSVFVLFVTIAMFLVVLVLPDSVFGSTPRVFAVAGFMGFVVMMVGVTYSDYKDRRYALEIPKGSRSHVGVSQISLLQRVSAAIECPKCHGNLVMEDIGEDMVYTCRYCGASGMIEIVFPLLLVIRRDFTAYAASALPCHSGQVLPVEQHLGIGG